MSAYIMFIVIQADGQSEKIMQSMCHSPLCGYNPCYQCVKDFVLAFLISLPYLCELVSTQQGTQRNDFQPERESLYKQR